MSWKKHFKPVNSVLPVPDASASNGTMVSRFSSWLPEVYQGPANRLQRYTQYDQMDFDHEVHAALDIIAEFSTQTDEKTNLPFVFQFNDTVTEEELKILNRVLKQWCVANQFSKRIFRIFRSVLKYGDQFFIRDPQTHKLMWVDPAKVEKAIVNESLGKKIEVYYIKDLDLNQQKLVGSNLHKKKTTGFGSADGAFPNSPLTGQPNYTSNVSMPNAGNSYTAGGQVYEVDAKHVVHISLSEGMDDAWPFGISYLEKIFKIYKQKELIEEALLIYRVHRAPERRVFQIDTGTMPPPVAFKYLEKVKNEIQQKRIPSKSGGGQSIMDSSYNPMSILEDYYFAVSADGRGSKVDTLPGGENLGQIDDVRYFNNKMLRALSIPSSYLPSGPEDGTFMYNDGRVGTAFIQEFRFQKACKRLQNQIIDEFDTEFKKFVKEKGYNLDLTMFNLSFTEPQSFSEYREIEINSAYANVFTSLSDVSYISKRFALMKYLGWKQEDILENERMIKEERSMDNASGTGSGRMSAPNMRQGGIMGSDFAEFEDPGDMDDMGGDIEGLDDIEADIDLGGDEPSPE